MFGLDKKNTPQERRPIISKHPHNTGVQKKVLWKEYKNKTQKRLF